MIGEKRIFVFIMASYDLKKYVLILNWEMIILFNMINNNKTLSTQKNDCENVVINLLEFVIEELFRIIYWAIFDVIQLETPSMSLYEKCSTYFWV